MAAPHSRRALPLPVFGFDCSFSVSMLPLAAEALTEWLKKQGTWQATTIACEKFSDLERIMVRGDSEVPDRDAPCRSLEDGSVRPLK